MSGVDLFRFKPEYFSRLQDAYDLCWKDRTMLMSSHNADRESVAKAVISLGNARHKLTAEELSAAAIRLVTAKSS